MLKSCVMDTDNFKFNYFSLAEQLESLSFDMFFLTVLKMLSRYEGFSVT